jgi:magnesium chelatase family protein
VIFSLHVIPIVVHYSVRNLSIAKDAKTMSLAVVHSRAHTGMQSQPVSVEVHLGGGLPSMSIVGLPETAVKESRDRVRSAILNAGFEFPAKRITINLAPADLPKEGGRFDLPIALGILAASDQMPGSHYAKSEFIGELALGGELRQVRAVLPSVVAANEAERSIYIPIQNSREAALVTQANVFPVGHLAEVVAHLCGKSELEPLQKSNDSSQKCYPEVRDVRGQEAAKRALLLAACGGHHLLLMGPPGAGKTMLAQRLPGLLPALNTEHALETATVHSLSHQGFDPASWAERPFRNPHHSISSAAMVGGGSNPRPGEISLAHNGVLFLDELPEFGAQVLDQLREPLETGQVNISRVACQRTFPARIQLVCAMNLCKCGRLGDARTSCQCSEDQVLRYQSRVSGPLLDRIDLQVDVKPVTFEQITTESAVSPGNEQLRSQVQEAHAVQLARQGCLNARLNTNDLQIYCCLPETGKNLLSRAMERMALSARSCHRIIKVARTIADIDQIGHIQVTHLAEAIQYRTQKSI